MGELIKGRLPIEVSAVLKEHLVGIPVTAEFRRMLRLRLYDMMAAHAMRSASAWVAFLSARHVFQCCTSSVALVVLH